MAVLAVQEKAQSKLAVGFVAAGMGVVVDGDVAAAAAEKNVLWELWVEWTCFWW